MKLKNMAVGQTIIADAHEDMVDWISDRFPEKYEHDNSSGDGKIAWQALEKEYKKVKVEQNIQLQKFKNSLKKSILSFKQASNKLQSWENWALVGGKKPSQPKAKIKKDISKIKIEIKNILKRASKKNKPLEKKYNEIIYEKLGNIADSYNVIVMYKDIEKFIESFNT